MPGFFGADLNIDAIPLAAVYAAAIGGGVDALLRSPLALPAPLPPLTEQQRTLLADLLGYVAVNGSLVVDPTNNPFGPLVNPDATVLGIPDASEQGFRPVSGPVDIVPLEQTTDTNCRGGIQGADQ